MAYHKGQSGNPAGKPKGANKTQKLLSAAPAILDAMVEQAKAGDTQAARVILERCLPALKPEARPPAAPVPTEPDAILAAVAQGQMTPDQGELLMNVLLMQGKIQEATEIMARLEAVERALSAIQR